MENKKTSMQELFDNLESIDIKVPIGVKKVFLDKEEEQIADAFYSGYEDRICFNMGMIIIIKRMGSYEKYQSNRIKNR